MRFATYRLIIAFYNIYTNLFVHSYSQAGSAIDATTKVWAYQEAQE